MKTLIPVCAFGWLLSALVTTSAWGQPVQGDRRESGPPEITTQKLSEFYMRDACILPVPEEQTYYIVASGRGATVRAYTSKDLINWTGPYTIYETPDDMWGEEVRIRRVASPEDNPANSRYEIWSEDVNINSIWAPEIHAYNGKYYLFATFSSTTEFLEQWRNWRPRVRRGTQVLVGDSPLGPFRAFSNEPTLPADMMTLDGTLWVEDGVPYMIYCHEWVQITNGTMEMFQLTDDLSATVGEPTRLFFGSEAPWNRPSAEEGCWVTDGCYLLTSKSGKLFMPWSSFSDTGYTIGVAVSESGKLAGPWVQQEEPLYTDDGGHSMFFRRFDGQLMMTLHTPNGGPDTRIKLFEVEDTGDTLRVLRPFPGE